MEVGSLEFGQYVLRRQGLGVWNDERAREGIGILVEGVGTERPRAAGNKIVRRRILLLMESTPAWTRWVGRLERIANPQQIHQALVDDVHVPNQWKRQISFERLQLAL